VIEATVIKLYNTTGIIYNTSIRLKVYFDIGFLATEEFYSIGHYQRAECSFGLLIYVHYIDQCTRKITRLKY